MKELLRKGKFVLAVFIFIWLLLGAILLIWNKSEIHLYINRFHSTFLDFFFKWITNLGDGLVPLFLFLAFLFISFRKALIIGLSGAFTGLLAQFFKRVVFSEVKRPKAFFNDIAELYFVPGVEIHHNFSFPSGHSATVFGLFIVFALFTSNKALQLFLLLMALLTGFSRIYLSQHFLIDVYFGALLGVIASLFVIVLLNRFNWSWLNSSIIKRNKNL